MDIDALKTAGAIQKLGEAIRGHLFLIRNCTEEAAKEDFEKLQSCVDSIHDLCVEIDQLHAEYRKLQEENEIVF